MANYKLDFTGQEINTRLEAVPGLEERIGKLESQNGSGANGQTETLVVPVDTTGIIINKNKVTLNNAIIQDGKKFSVIEFVPKATYSISQIVIENSPNITLKLNGAILQANTMLRGFTSKDGAYVTGGETAFIKVNNSHFFTIENGIIDGASMVSKGMEIKYSTKATIKNIELCNIGNQDTTPETGIAGATGIFFLGTCDDFLIQQCYIHDIYSRISKYYINDKYKAWDERRIHTYGIFVDEFKKTKTDENNVTIVTEKHFSANGVITNTILEKINRTDSEGDQGKTPDAPGTALKKLEYEGEGIFIQQLPWNKITTKEDGSTNTQVVIPRSNIRIENCKFNYCKKRGIKATSRNIYIKNCGFYGKYYYAPIEFQYGDSSVENCYIENGHGTNIGGNIGGIGLCEGGIVIKDTYIDCKRKDMPGIFFNTRNNRSPYYAISTEPWKKCVFERVNIEKAATGIYIKGSGDYKEFTCDSTTINEIINEIINEDSSRAEDIEIKRDENNNPISIKVSYPARIEGIDILDCSFRYISSDYFVDCTGNIFNQIDSLRFIDFKTQSKEDTISFPISIPRKIYLVPKDESSTYPTDPRIHDKVIVYTDVAIVKNLEIYSRHWNSKVCMIHGDKAGEGTYTVWDPDKKDMTEKECWTYSEIQMPPRTLIIHGYYGNNVKYKKTTWFNSQIIGTLPPKSLTGNDQAFLVTSRPGDEYIYDAENGTREKYVCTGPGIEERPVTDNNGKIIEKASLPASIGTWEKVIP